MATISVQEFISLDGVFEDPSWTFEFGFDPAMGESVGAITADATALLLGRRTHEMFAPGWRDRTVEDDPGVPFFNDSEKLVVGSTPSSEEWAHTTAVGPYSPELVASLKAERSGVLYVSGSGQLVRSMLADGLVDELHLFVYPVALGSGARLWDGVDQTRLALLASDVYANGVVHLCYGPA